MKLLKKNIFGVDITDAFEKEILEYIISTIKEDRKISIVTPNPEIVMYARKHPTFREIINRAEISLPDGIGLIWAGKILGKGLREKISGTDFILTLCKKASEESLSIALLGARQNVALKASNRLKELFPNLNVVFVSSSDPTIDSVKELKGQSKPIDILFVAYGFPKQEEWIDRHLSKDPVRVAMAVGGAFDYISGEVIRAPKVIRVLGFEWLFRVFRQPWRAKRQLALVEFVCLVLKEKVATSFRA